MDERISEPRDAANGTKSALLHEDWDYLSVIALEDFGPGEFALLDSQRVDYYGERQAYEAIRTLKVSAEDSSFGYQINNYRHCLQSATLAYNAGKDEEYVALAALHDIGFIIAPTNHGSFAAALMGPYISPNNEWMLAHHAIFQNAHCIGHPTMDRYGREQWRGHPAFAQTVEFVAMFDQGAMDPNYENMPIEAFEPMIHRMFAKPPRTISLE